MYVCVFMYMYVCRPMYDVRHDIQIPCTRYVAINRLYLYLYMLQSLKGVVTVPNGLPLTWSDAAREVIPRKSR